MNRTARIAIFLMLPGYSWAASPVDLEPSLADLGDLAERYPQDPGLALRCAWVATEDGDHAAAVTWYERALEANADHYEARLGLAWARWNLGEDTQAAFRVLVDERPGERRALDGLEASRYGRSGMQSSVGATVSLYPGDPGRLHGEGLAAGVSGWRGSLVGGASYRGTRFVVLDPAGGEALQPGQPPTMGGETLSSAQHEAWAWGGLARARWGTTLHAAGIMDGSDDGGNALVLGAMARVGTPLGPHLLTELSTSLYGDLTLHRVGLSWSQPVGPLTLTPIAAVQLAGDSPYVSAGLELGREGERLDVRLGGKLGREQRPALLGSALVYNLPGTITGGTWAGASLDLDSPWTPSLTTELFRLQADDEALPVSDFWVLTSQLGLTRSF